MTVHQLLQTLPVKVLHQADENREISGVYTGDLLSWVMGRAQPDQVLVTIMTNINVVAVASLLDLSLVVICDNALPDDAMLEAAKSKGVNVVTFEGTSYEMCVLLAKLCL